MKDKLTKEQKREIFKNHSPETQWTIIKSQLDIFTSCVRAKMSVLLSLGAISIAMIAILTLNPDIVFIPIFYTKIIISVLLISIPVSLIIFLSDQETAAERSLGFIEDYTGKDPKKDLTMDKDTKFAAYFPFSMTIIYFIIVWFILHLMWIRPGAFL